MQVSRLKIGNTPLVELKSFSDKSIKIYAKLEWYNPFGSVKDRPAYWMIEDAEKRGVIDKEKTILIEPTSGNTGIALAGIAKNLGYKVEVVVPEKVSNETKILARLLGAKVLEVEDDLCPKVGKGTDQSIALAQAIVKGHPNKYFMPNQYENEANFLSHYEGTGPEIWEELNGKITHFITGIGTGGTITGVGTFLKERNKNVKVISVEPQKNHHIQGLRNLEESSMPKVLERRKEVIDEWLKVSDKEAFDTVREIYHKEKLLVGPSSGGVLAATLRIKDKVKEGILVVIFADDGRKYRSVYENFKVFDEEFDSLIKNSKYMPPNSLFMQNLSIY
ncbi:MAG: cysteine synthase family protein [Nitrososphaerales archaeon]